MALPETAAAQTHICKKNESEKTRSEYLVAYHIDIIYPNDLSSITYTQVDVVLMYISSRLKIWHSWCLKRSVSARSFPYTGGGLRSG